MSRWSEPTKKCYRCMCFKPLSEFDRAKRPSKDGKSRWCSNCNAIHREKQQEWRRRNGLKIDAGNHPRPGTKFCGDCHQVKPAAEFSLSRSSKDGLNHHCKACNRISCAEWWKAKGDKRKAHAKNHSLKYEYGITLEEFERIKAEQHDSCAICKQPGVRLYVDHNHTTSAVRGLLCPRCNALLAGVEDKHFLDQARRYLKVSEQKSSVNSAPKGRFSMSRVLAAMPLDENEVVIKSSSAKTGDLLSLVRGIAV